MKLYEINEEIQHLTDQIEFDDETGEILCDIDAIYSGIAALQMERKSILEYLAKLVLNLRAESAAVKAEEQRLKKRRDKLTRKEERLVSILDRECAGEKTDLGVATLSYRKTSHVEVADSNAAVLWLRNHNYRDCYRVPAPEVSKAGVKKLINGGEHVPGCAVVEDLSCSLK